MSSKSLILAVLVTVLLSSCSSAKDPAGAPSAADQDAEGHVDAVNDPSPLRVFDPDDEDDVPDVRNIWLDDCPSGIARQRQQGTLEPIARAPTDWGAASQAVRGSVPNADQALSEPDEARVGGLPGTRWTIVDAKGDVRAIVETFEAPAGDGWGSTEPALCLDP